jgi:protein-disulfide isomerase
MAKTTEQNGPAPSADRTLKILLLVMTMAVVFALGRWSVGGDRLEQLEANQQRLEQQLAGRAGNPPARNAATPPANAEAGGLKTGIDLAIAGRPSLGSASAPVTFIEFSDFQCPFCGRFVRDTFPQIKAGYVDSGKVKYVFRHYPIDSLHPQAPLSARAADCGQAQGLFWPMHERLFGDPRDHSPQKLTAVAKAAGLNMTTFGACMNGPARPTVAEDLDAGSRGGMMGTPAFFIGATNGDGPVKVTRTVYGAKPFEAFKAAIDAALLTAGK